MNKRRRPPTPPPRGGVTKLKPAGGSTRSSPTAEAIQSTKLRSTGTRDPASSGKGSPRPIISDDKSCSLHGQNVDTLPIKIISGSQLTPQTYSGDQSQTSQLHKESDLPEIEENIPLFSKVMESKEGKKGR